jgi:integrase/recombinase XerD
MATNKVTTGIYLDTRRKKSDGTYTVTLRVTYRRKTQLFATNYSMHKADFQKAMGEKPRGDYKVFAQEFMDIEKKAIAIIEKMPDFSFDRFRERYRSHTTGAKDVYQSFQDRINELRSEGRHGNADIYQNALHALQRFHPGHTLPFEHLDANFFNKFEKWHISGGGSLTSVGIYVRTIMSIVNKAIRQKDAVLSDYPVGREPGQYKIPAPQNLKRSLTLDEIKKIFTYQPVTGSTEHLYRDIWIFCYLCNGINIKDLCMLRYRDLHGDFITYRRAKTINTNRNSKPIEAVVTPEMDEIITRWGNPIRAPEYYIFLFIDDSMSAEKQHARIKQTTKQTNKYIRGIARKVGIDETISTYTARHSFATILKRSGVPPSYISDALGHSSLKTTENYLGSFENEQKKQIVKQLTKFTS